MARHFVPLFILLLLMACTSCFESGGGSVCFLEGPSEMDEDSTASFTVSVVGQEAESYDWMIDPPTAGNFDNPHAPEIKFHARPLTSIGDLKATVGVAVTLRTGVVYKSKQITIKYVPADHQPPLGNLPPVAAAHSDFKAVEPGGTVHFFDDSTDPNGKDDIVKWEWDFSFDPLDGFISESEDQNPAHVFEDEGLYSVQLRVTDSTGLSDMLDDPIQIAVTVGEIAPVALAHAESIVVVEGTFNQFFDDSIDANGQPDIVKWEWDFSYVPSEGFHAESQDQNPVVQFPDIGTFQVQLRVTDTSGLSDMLDTPIEIQVVTSDFPPIAQAHALSTAVNEGAYIKFIDDSTDADGQSDIVKREWDFSYVESDGFQTESQEQNPLVQFPTVGTFDVQLRVTDTYELTDMLDSPLQITVYRPGWAVSWRGEEYDTTVRAIAVDKDGNTYVAGLAPDSTDFDPGPAEFNLQIDAGNSYISRFDSDGKFQWAVEVGARIDELCAGDFDGVYFGAENFKAYWADTPTCFGYVSSTGQGSEILQPLGNNYASSNGSTYAEEETRFIDMFVDSSANLYFALYHRVEYGYIEWDYSFEPPQGTDVPISVTSNYLIRKYSQSGDPKWERLYGDNAIEGIADRHDGTILAYFTDYPFSFTDCSLALLDSSGKVIWDYAFPSDVYIRSISCDQNSNSFYLGQSYPSEDLDPGPGSYYVTEKGGMFLCKLDSNMQFVWGRDWSANMLFGYPKGNPPIVKIDNSGNAFIASFFMFGVDVDPGPGLSWFGAFVPGAADNCVIVLDPDGVFKWAALYSTWHDDANHGQTFYEAEIAPDAEGYAHFAGYFSLRTDFDPGVGIDIHTTYNNDGFYAYNETGFLSKISPGDIW